MTVRVLFFGVLAERMGRRSETREVADGTTLETLWKGIVAGHPALAGAPPPAFARNAVFTAPGVALRDGDEVAFLPPVGGG
jgi:molybdopterin converting factor small subunit